MSALELINVGKDYKLDNRAKFTALSDININFDKGELVSIVGESGSGKSTLMNLIGGLDSKYTGMIKIGGHDLKDFKEQELDDYRKKKIGFVFQSFNLIPHLSVMDNVTIGLTLSNEKESIKNQKAMEILTKLGLKDQIKKKPTQLSGGQKQRVAIARALINDPDIILADEPTGSLDSTTTEQILEILKEIADDGKLVIMVTHSEHVASVSSRIVEIADGRIIKDERNENYEKTKKEDRLTTETLVTPNKNKKGHLSLFSALKLSIHNMWASKTKNILMSIGVSISLISFIMMMSFGAGLTGYISDQASSFTDNKVVSFTKKGMASTILPETFTDEEINDLKLELNDYLKDKSNFSVISKEEDDVDYNLSYGFSSITAGGSVKIIYTPIKTSDGSEPVETNSDIFYTYTTPPYYTDKNLISQNGHIAGSEENPNEIMLSASAIELFGYDNAEDIVGTKVTLKINMSGISFDKEVTISSIIDVSLFAGQLVMFVDYNYLNDCVTEAQSGKHMVDPSYEITGLRPSTLYIKTGDPKITELINNYIKENREDLSGSLEEKLVAMFNQMLDTFSIALTTISGISLAVALIMILVVLYMSVSERTREIGVLKSIGARKKDINLIFSSESFLVGILAGITGIIFSLIIGGILTIIFNSILGFAPIKMMWYFFFEALGISVVISLLAGLYPSAKAGKLDPVESLRHE